MNDDTYACIYVRSLSPFSEEVLYIGQYEVAMLDGLPRNNSDKNALPQNLRTWQKL